MPVLGAEPTSIEFFTDFVSTSPWDSFWADQNSNGALTASSATGIAPRIGGYIFSTGTNASGRRHAAPNLATVIPSAGKTFEMAGAVRFPAQPLATELSEHIFGFVDTFSGTIVRGALFRLTWTGGAVLFEAFSRNNNTPETTPLTVPGASEWLLLNIRMSATAIEYFVNGALVATHTNMSTAAMQPAVGARKLATGTGARTTEVDWMAFRATGIPSPRV